MTTRKSVKSTKSASRKTAKVAKVDKNKKAVEVKEEPKVTEKVATEKEVKMIDSLLEDLNQEEAPEVKPTEPAEPAKLDVNQIVEKALANLNEDIEKAIDAVSKKAAPDEQYFALKKLIGETTFSQKKVKEKALGLLKFLTGGKLNKVIEIALTVLKRDGYLEGGEKGNLFQELLKKPYSKGTARAQSGQIIYMFPLLGFAARDGKRLIPTPDVEYLYEKVFAS